MYKIAILSVKSTKKASNGIYILLKISLNTQGEVWRF